MGAYKVVLWVLKVTIWYPPSVLIHEKKKFHHIAYEMKAYQMRTPKIFIERKSDIGFESYSQNSFGSSKF